MTAQPRARAQRARPAAQRPARRDARHGRTRSRARGCPPATGYSTPADPPTYRLAGMRPSKPTFQNVLDLGLRDVGVRNDPRRLAAYLGKLTVPLAVLFVVFVVAACALIRWTGAGRWPVVAFAVVWTAGVV